LDNLDDEILEMGNETDPYRIDDILYFTNRHQPHPVVPATRYTFAEGESFFCSLTFSCFSCQPLLFYLIFWGYVKWTHTKFSCFVLSRIFFLSRSCLYETLLDFFLFVCIFVFYTLTIEQNEIQWFSMIYILILCTHLSSWH
jgi:hypothetical protein